MNNHIVTKSNKSQQLHFSKYTVSFPFTLLCGICIEDSVKSRRFKNSREKFFHLHLRHKDQPYRLQKELEELEFLVNIHQKGVMIK